MIIDTGKAVAFAARWDYGRTREGLRRIRVAIAGLDAGEQTPENVAAAMLLRRIVVEACQWYGSMRLASEYEAFGG